MGLYITRKRSSDAGWNLAIVAILLAAALVWGYNLGSMAYSKTQARAYMKQNCELLANAHNPNDKWWECDE